MSDSEDGLKVGELARASGLSTRTVRYYDQIGLLTPSRRSVAGHRVYDDTDVRRLYRICLLRRAGLPLAEIGKALDEPGWDLHQAMLAHLKLLDHQQAVGAALRRRLAAMLSASGTDSAPTTGQLLETMEDMTMLDDTLQRRISSSMRTSRPCTPGLCGCSVSAPGASNTTTRASACTARCRPGTA